MFDHTPYFDKKTIVMSNPWQIAVWRLEMISTPLDAKLTRAQKRSIIRDRTKQAVQWPDSSDERPIGKSTLLRWLKNYRDKGFLGLMPKVRKDKGLARAVPQKIFNKIIEVKCSNPKFTCNNINSYLKKHYNLEINRSTYHRYMKQKSEIIQSFSSVCIGEKFDTQLVREKDRSILEQWRKSKNKRKWEKAVVILESNNLSAKQLSVKIERPVKIIQKWVRDYTNQGIGSIEKDRKKGDRSKYDKIIFEKTNRILEILHQNPRLFGINRSNWSCQCIANVYKKEYGENLSKCTVARYLKNNSNYKIGKSRKVLTSPDPNYREKVELLLKILHSLKPEEMLFFLSMSWDHFV
jgi:transposase